MVSKNIIVILSLFALILHATSIPRNSKRNPITNNGCKCSFIGNNCRISTPAAPNKACKCWGPDRYFEEWKYPWARCYGEEVECFNKQSIYCIKPDTSRMSCLEGQGSDGFCDAYPWAEKPQQGGCSCKYSEGGCRITIPAPKNYACRCQYGPQDWTCSGRVELCSQVNSTVCKNPDTSLKSCEMARGYGDCNSDVYQKERIPTKFQKWYI